MGGGEAAKDGSDERLIATDAAKAYKRGLALCGDGSYEKALIMFDEAIAFRVDCSHYFAARANCKQAMGANMDAYHDYVSAIRLNRTKCTYFSCRGLCLMKIGKLEAALSDFSKACELEPTAAVYHYQKASLLHHHLARPGAAVMSYGDCLANARPGDSAMTLRCLYGKGSCLLEEGRAAEAVEDLSRAVEVSNPSPSALHYFAKALKEVGREEQALEVLGEAIDKWCSSQSASDGRPSDNNGHELYFDRGVLRLNRGDDAGAVSDLDEAVALSGGARGGYFVQRARARARVAMRSHGREEAVAGLQDIEKAMELEPTNTEFLFAAGVLCSRMGEYDHALVHLQRLSGVYEAQAAAARSAKWGGVGVVDERAGGRAGGGAASPTVGGVNSAPAPASPRESDAPPGGKDRATSPAACEFEMALCLYKLGRPLEALRLAEPAVASWCLQDAQRFQLRGLIKHDLKRFGEAVKDFTASIAINGQKPEGFLLRGRSLASQSRHERAVDDFTTALHLLNPKTGPRASEPHEVNAAEQKQNQIYSDIRRARRPSYEESVEEQKQEDRFFSESNRGDIPRSHGADEDDDNGDDDRDTNFARSAGSEALRHETLLDDDDFSTSSDSNRHEYGIASRPNKGGTARPAEDGNYHGAKRETSAGGLAEGRHFNGATRETSAAGSAEKVGHYRDANRDTPAAGLIEGGQYHGARRDAPAESATASDKVTHGDGGDGMVEWGSVAGACHYARALSLQQLGRYADAAHDFDEAVAEGPVTWQRLWHRAICLAELGEAFRASAASGLRACLTMAEEAKLPEMPHFLFQVGLAFLRLGDSATALTNFYRSREFNLPPQDNPPPDGAPGVAREGEEEGRQPAYAVPVERFEASLHYHIGVCLTKSGDLVQAEDEFSAAIACPNGRQEEATGGGVSAGESSSCSDEELRAEFHRERGKVRQLLRNFKGARADFTACLKRVDTRESSPHDARTLFRRGWANKALGKLVEAAADFEAARMMEPAHPSLSVDYRNIFDIELVVVDDIESVTQSPALFHNW